MVQALIPLLMAAVSAGGAYIGGKRTYLDENWLNERFGTNAFTKEMAQMLDYLIQSPYGQQMLSSAGAQAQSFETETNAAAARAGMGGGGGGESGASTFAVGAANAADNSFRRDALSQMQQMGAGIVQQNMAQRLAAIMGDRQAGGIAHPNAAFANAISGAASTGALAYGQGKQNTTTTTADGKVVPTASTVTAPVSPMARVNPSFGSPSPPATYFSDETAARNPYFGPRATRLLRPRGNSLLYSSGR